MNGKYEEIYNRSIKDPDGFWSEAAEDIIWEKRWDTVLNVENPPFYRWFKGGYVKYLLQRKSIDMLTMVMVSKMRLFTIVPQPVVISKK